MSKPIRVFYSPVTGRFYATKEYQLDVGVVTITGKKFDVTDDIAHAVTAHRVEFVEQPSVVVRRAAR